MDDAIYIKKCLKRIFVALINLNIYLYKYILQLHVRIIAHVEREMKICAISCV